MQSAATLRTTVPAPLAAWAAIVSPRAVVVATRTRLVPSARRPRLARVPRITRLPLPFVGVGFGAVAAAVARLASLR
jgi:hypothetical protein